MTESPANLRRLALEIIATLVNIKRVSADQLLRRANVDENLIRRFLTDRDPATGAKASKRVAGAMVLDELAKEGRDLAVIGKLIEIAAGWDAFHLAGDEYVARATVQKAREVSRRSPSRRTARGSRPRRDNVKRPPPRRRNRRPSSNSKACCC